MVIGIGRRHFQVLDRSNASLELETIDLRLGRIGSEIGLHAAGQCLGDEALNVLELRMKDIGIDLGRHVTDRELRLYSEFDIDGGLWRETKLRRVHAAGSESEGRVEASRDVAPARPDVDQGTGRELVVETHRPGIAVARSRIGKEAITLRIGSR